jgi:hypothetical protein
MRFNASWMKSFEFMLTQQVPMRRVKSQRRVALSVSVPMKCPQCDKMVNTSSWAAVVCLFLHKAEQQLVS